MKSQDVISSLISARRQATESGFDQKPPISILEKYTDSLHQLITEFQFEDASNLGWVKEKEVEIVTFKSNLHTIIGKQLSEDYKDNWLLQKIFLDKLLRNYIDRINSQALNTLLTPNNDHKTKFNLGSFDKN